MDPGGMEIKSDGCDWPVRKGARAGDLHDTVRMTRDCAALRANETFLLLSASLRCPHATSTSRI